MNDDLFIFLSIFVSSVALGTLIWVVFKDSPLATKIRNWVDILNGETIDGTPTNKRD